MDLAEEKLQRLESIDRRNRDYPEANSDCTKSCADCHTTKTPLWRAGPSGPKSLCNACGIRYQKSRRRAALGIKGGERQMKSGGAKMGFLLKLMLNRKQGVLREEEEAAVLLMALSSGLLCNQ